MKCDRGGETTQEHEVAQGEEGGWTHKEVAVAEGVQGSAKVTALEIHVRDDVASSDPLVEPCTCQIPENLKPANFENQLREIDKAIMGEMLVLGNSIAEGGILNISDELQSRE